MKNEDGPDPVIVSTCFIKNFKFVETAFPDYAGRYVYREYEVYRKSESGYVPAQYAEFFNNRLQELLAIINQRIQLDFAAFKKDTNTRDCVMLLDSIPTYKMEDLSISFYKKEIWFTVQWGLPSACRAVDGSIVSFRLPEIRKYIR